LRQTHDTWYDTFSTPPIYVTKCFMFAFFNIAQPIGKLFHSWRKPFPLSFNLYTFIFFVLNLTIIRCVVLNLKTKVLYRIKIDRVYLFCFKNLKEKQEGHNGPESLTRNNRFSVLECQYILILDLSLEYV
jgi:hypothetical protein